MNDDVQPLIESQDVLSNGAELQRRLRRDGYLFVRGLLPRDNVLAVRHAILQCCADAGWLRLGTDVEAALTDHEPIPEGAPPMRPVYLQVQKLELFHRLKLHPNVQRLMETLFDEPAVALPNTIARISFPRDNAQITQPHQDWLYIQGSTETLTCWTPLGDIPAEVGGLKVQAGSHKAGFMMPRKAAGPGGHTVDLDEKLPWHASPYQAGDVLMLTALTVHGARPNFTSDRMRLSMDFRYAGLSHAVAESNLLPHFHWFGPEFSWDNLDKDWQDAALRRYWERIPNLRVVAHDQRVFVK